MENNEELLRDDGPTSKMSDLISSKELLSIQPYEDLVTHDPAKLIHKVPTAWMADMRVILAQADVDLIFGQGAHQILFEPGAILPCGSRD